MRSDTEHLNQWDEAVQGYPADQREDVCWHRTRQIEHLACDAYSRLLRDAALRDRFRADGTIADFWSLPDGQRGSLWESPSTSPVNLSCRSTISGKEHVPCKKKNP